MKIKITFVVGVVLALTAFATGAIGSSSPPNTLQSADALSPTDQIRSAFPTLASTNSNASDAPEIRHLRESFASTAESNPISSASFANAQPVPISGSDARAWLVPAANRVCAFIPDPVDGYGAGCVTLEDIRAGHGFSLLSNEDRVLALAYVPVGDLAPTVEANGKQVDFKLTGNAAAGVLPPGSTISSDNGELRVGSDPDAVK